MNGRKHHDKKKRMARTERSGDRRLQYLRRIYMRNRAEIERRFLAEIDDNAMPARDIVRSLQCFREGAIEILGAIEEVFGTDGVEAISRHFRHASISRLLSGSDENEDYEEEYEYCPRLDDFDDTRPAYERIEAHLRNLREQLAKEKKALFELYEKDDMHTDKEDEDDEDGLEIDLPWGLVDLDSYRNLWKGFDSMYR